MDGNIRAVTAPGRPPGCFRIQSGPSCGIENAEVSAAPAEVVGIALRRFSRRVSPTVKENEAASA